MRTFVISLGKIFFYPTSSQNEYLDRKEKGLGFIKNFVESEKELKSIREDVRREKFLEDNKGFQEFHHVTDEEILFYEYLYKRERKYRTVILILSLVCLGLLLSIWT